MGIPILAVPLTVTLVAVHLVIVPTDDSWAAETAVHARPAQVDAVVRSLDARSDLKMNKTTVAGWEAARRAPDDQTLLGSLLVPGSARRPVKAQKKRAGMWTTIRVLRTSARGRLDLRFIHSIPGSWRLRVPAHGKMRGFATSVLRIRTPPLVASRKPGKSRRAAGTLTGSSGAYGTSYNMDTLANMQVGGPASGASNTSVSYRFRAEQSSTLTAFRAYWLGAAYPGYGGGTGGTIRVSVQSDDNGLPSGTSLASLDVVHPSADMPLLKFTSPATLTAGTRYHLVFSNIDPAPTTNFASVDLSYVYGSTQSPRQPNTSDDDYAALRKLGSGSWSVQGGYTPIIDLTYGNNMHQGHGYMEVEVANKAMIAGTSNLARERFTVSGGDRLVTSAGIRIAKTNGTGNLLVRLEDANGTLIDSFTASTASVPTLTSGDGSSGVWVTGSFASPRQLTNGATYNLRLSTDSSTSLWTRGIQQGSTYGFNKATYFDDGALQVTTNGGSTWNTITGLGAEGDLQFYLH